MHHYGRHGQGAWLRQYWRRRQQNVSISAIVEKPDVPVVVIYVPFLVQVERIIVIVAEDNDNFTGTSPLVGQPTVVAGHLVPQDTEALPRVLSTEQWVKSVATSDADDFLAETISELPLDIFLVLDRRNAETVAKNRGRDCILRVQSEFPQKIKDIYTKAFVDVLEAAKDGPLTHRFLSDDEWEMQKIVKKDKEEERLERSRKYHQRDLAVIRAQEGLSLPTIEESLHRLDEIHTWADRYEAACREPKDWMVWPSADYFRSR